jgi:hypothetical protein
MVALCRVLCPMLAMLSIFRIVISRRGEEERGPSTSCELAVTANFCSYKPSPRVFTVINRSDFAHAPLLANNTSSTSPAEYVSSTMTCRIGNFLPKQISRKMKVIEGTWEEQAGTEFSELRDRVNKWLRSSAPPVTSVDNIPNQKSPKHANEMIYIPSTCCKGSMTLYHPDFADWQTCED